MERFMTSIAKKSSLYCGKKFLQQAFHKEQGILMAALELSEASITHDGKRGEVDEKHFIDILRKYLPDRYAVDSAIIIDSNGHTSDQIDVVIYDHQYTPTLLDQKDHKYVPAEAVYGIFEVKPIINKTYLIYTADKASSVRSLFSYFRADCPRWRHPSCKKTFYNYFGYYSGTYWMEGWIRCYLPKNP